MISAKSAESGNLRDQFLREWKKLAVQAQASTGEPAATRLAPRLITAATAFLNIIRPGVSPCLMPAGRRVQ
jgi:hypothetical protein